MYVSNLSSHVTNEDLRPLFSQYGEVTSVKVISDRDTGKSRGFAFVEMADKAGETAMKELNGTLLEGKTLSVSIARPKSDSGGSYSRERSNRW